MKFKYSILFLTISLLAISCDEDSTCAECPEDQSVHGCLDSLACNYDPDANIENNSCEYPVAMCECDQDPSECSYLGKWKVGLSREYETGSCLGDNYDEYEYTDSSNDLQNYWELNDDGSFVNTIYYLGTCASYTGNFTVLSESHDTQNQNIYSDYTMLIEMNSDSFIYFFAAESDNLTLWSINDGSCVEMSLDRSSQQIGCQIYLINYDLNER